MGAVNDRIYMGKPLEAGKEAEVWEALLGLEQNYTVWLGEKMAGALSRAEAAPAQIKRYELYSFGVLGIATVIYHFLPRLPRPISLSTAWLLDCVVFEGLHSWQVREGRRCHKEADKRIEEHRRLLVNLAGSKEFGSKLIQFLKEEKLLTDELLGNVHELRTIRIFDRSIRYHVWLNPIGFNALLTSMGLKYVSSAEL